MSCIHNRHFVCAAPAGSAFWKSLAKKVFFSGGCIVLGIFVPGGLGIAQSDMSATDEQKACDEVAKATGRDLWSANEAKKEGHYEKAVELYKMVATTWNKYHWHNDRVEAFRRSSAASAINSAAYLKKDTGDSSSAAGLFLQAEEEWPDPVTGENIFGAADSYFEDDQYDKAEELYKSQLGSAMEAVLRPLSSGELVEEARAKQSAEANSLQDLLPRATVEQKAALRRRALYSLAHLYERERKLDLKKRVIEAIRDRHCPVCGSDADVIPNTKPTPATVHTDYVNGASVITSLCPRWFCTKDKILF